MDTDTSKSKYKVPNLERALIIMEYLVDHRQGMGITELTEALGFSKNSVFRIATTLMEKGYLVRDGQKRFSLSRKLLAMGCAAMEETHIIESALDIMRECRDDFQETVLIGTMYGAEGLVMEQVLGTHPFKFSLDLGARLLVHTSAPCKAMVAYMSEREQEDIISQVKFTRHTENTITTKRGFMRELSQIRKCGFALDCAEQLNGIHCLSAPVFNQYSQPVAAIWITGPADRLPFENPAELGNKMRSYANKISKKLGYRAIEEGS